MLKYPVITQYRYDGVEFRVGLRHNNLVFYSNDQYRHLTNIRACLRDTLREIQKRYPDTDIIISGVFTSENATLSDISAMLRGSNEDYITADLYDVSLPFSYEDRHDLLLRYLTCSDYVHVVPYKIQRTREQVNREYAISIRDGYGTLLVRSYNDESTEVWSDLPIVYILPYSAQRLNLEQVGDHIVWRGQSDQRIFDYIITSTVPLNDQVTKSVEIRFPIDTDQLTYRILIHSYIRTVDGRLIVQAEFIDGVNDQDYISIPIHLTENETNRIYSSRDH